MNAAKSLLNLLSTALALPSFLCACGCAVLGSAVARGSFWGFVDGIFAALAILLPWGILAIAIGFALLIAAGFSPRRRRIAAGIVATLAVASAAFVLRFFGLPADLTDLWVFIPGLLGALIAGGLAFSRA